MVVGLEPHFCSLEENTYLRRFSVHWRKKTHLRRFFTGVYKEVSFNSWRGHIFHSAQSYFPLQVFLIVNPRPSDNQRGGNMRYIFMCKKQCTLRYVFISEFYLIVLILAYERM